MAHNKIIDRCPVCGTTDRERGACCFACGMSIWGNGLCTRFTPPKTTEMKPRIRVMFDNDHSPEEVRVIMASPTKDTQTYNEFNNLLLVDADEKRGTVSTIRLNCKTLGGKIYEEALLALVADYRRLAKRWGKGVPILLDKHLKACAELLGTHRIGIKINKIEKEREQKWGALHALLEDTAINRFGNTEAKDKLQNFIKSYGDLKAVLKEAITITYEELSASGSGRGTTVVRHILQTLTHAQLLGFLKDAAAGKSYEIPYWQMFQRALVDRADMPPFEYTMCLMAIYDGHISTLPSDDLIGIDSDSHNRQSILEMIDIRCSGAMPTDHKDIVLEFLKKVRGNDPAKELKTYAEAITNALKEQAAVVNSAEPVFHEVPPLPLFPATMAYNAEHQGPEPFYWGDEP